MYGYTPVSHELTREIELSRGSPTSICYIVALLVYNLLHCTKEICTVSKQFPSDLKVKSTNAAKRGRFPESKVFRLLLTSLFLQLKGRYRNTICLQNLERFALLSVYNFLQLLQLSHFFENLWLLRCGNHFIYHKVVPNGHLKLGLIPLILVYCWTLRVCCSGECPSKVLETRPFYDGELFLSDLIVEKTSYIKFM